MMVTGTVIWEMSDDTWPSEFLLGTVFSEESLVMASGGHTKEWRLSWVPSLRPSCMRLEEGPSIGSKPERGKHAHPRNSIFLLALLAVCGVMTSALAVDASPRSYYVDSVRGDDENPGTEKAPWKSLDSLSELVLKPGDSVYFVRGSSFHGGVTIASSGTEDAPITFTSTGEGALPRFTNTDVRHLNGNVFLVTGSHIIIDGLYFHNGPAAPPSLRPSPVRQMGAVFVGPGAEYNIIRNCEVYDYPVGFQSYGTHCLITGNYIHDCTGFLQYPYWGPVGIMVAASHHEISYNRIENYVAIGGAWGSDGGAIELDSDEKHPREDIEIHHNVSVGNEGFLEVTKGPAKGDPRDVHVHHNISDDWQQFILFWGGRDCVVEHNTVLCRRPRNSNVHVVFTFPKDWLDNMRVRNNIFVVGEGLQVFNGVSPYSASDYDQPRDHNLYYCLDGSVKDPCGLPLGPGDAVGDPRFVNLETMDLRLRSGSPAIDMAADSGLPIDFDGKPRISGKSPDKGAFEFHGRGK